MNNVDRSHEMTTNQERTQQIIAKWIDENLPHSEESVWADEAIAEALADAGLLMPDVDVPEPSYCVQEFGDIYLGQSLEWEDYGISIAFGKRIGGDKGPELHAPEQEFSNPESVRTYAAYLLEAAKRMEAIEDLEKYGI